MSIIIGMKIFDYIKNPSKIVIWLQNHRKLDWMPDKAYLKLIFWARMKKRLNLKNPQTYNEKLQWLKLYDRKDIYSTMVDKYESKEYVAGIIGEEYIIPTLGVWDKFDDIDFASLPQQFVLKCTHDSGGVVICKDKKSFDKDLAKSILDSSLKNRFFYYGREWAYEGVKPRIIAEKYMEDKTSNDLKDYKFFTFNGKVKALFIASDRNEKDEETKFDFFDRGFNHIEVKNGHPNANTYPEKPENFDKMIELAEKLAKDTCHLRVDFYEVNGKIYFGELTFFHWSGFVPFEPEEWDYTFGEWLHLPKRKK